MQRFWVFRKKPRKVIVARKMFKNGRKQQLVGYEANTGRKERSCRWLTCAIPAPICPPPMIVTCLITTFLIAEEEKPLRTWWVKKAMCKPAVGGLRDGLTLTAGWRGEWEVGEGSAITWSRAPFFLANQNSTVYKCLNMILKPLAQSLRILNLINSHTFRSTFAVTFKMLDTPDQFDSKCAVTSRGTSQED